MHWGKEERVTFCSECTSMLITISAVLMARVRSIYLGSKIFGVHSGFDVSSINGALQCHKHLFRG